MANRVVDGIVGDAGDGAAASTVGGDYSIPVDQALAPGCGGQGTRGGYAPVLNLR